MLLIEDAKTKFFKSKEDYLNFRKTWAKDKHHSSQDIIIYNLLRGKPANNGFTPITKTVKLANGCRPNQAYEAALYGVKYWARNVKDPYLGYLGIEKLKLLQEYLR